MIKVQVLNNPLPFMKRVPDPDDDLMPGVMWSASDGCFEDFKVFLAKKDGVTAGWAVLYWPNKKKTPKFMIWTSRKFRKNGVASAIYKRVVSFTNKITVFSWDRRSGNFYEKMQEKYPETEQHVVWY